METEVGKEKEEEFGNGPEVFGLVLGVSLRKTCSKSLRFFLFWFCEYEKRETGGIREGRARRKRRIVDPFAFSFSGSSGERRGICIHRAKEAKRERVKRAYETYLHMRTESRRRTKRRGKERKKACFEKPTKLERNETEKDRK